jgi:hypothetical protein
LIAVIVKLPIIPKPATPDRFQSILAEAKTDPASGKRNPAH